LVKLYDCFADQINLYLFVELGCDGHLYGLLNKKGPVSEEAISVISREVTRGICYMHTQNVLHRDIKLENIVFTHVISRLIQGMAKICDFGWAVYEPQ
jgi:serine/threonine protein kinase